MIIARRLVLSIFLLGLGAGCSGGGDPAGPDSEKLEAPDDVGGIPDDAEILEPGIGWRLLVEGTGTRNPGLDDIVRVHYVGWQTDGHRFDSSYERGRPAQFVLRDLISGWVYALRTMVEGEERRLWIPEDLAYGNSTDPETPKGMLVFDVALIEINPR